MGRFLPSHFFAWCKMIDFTLLKLSDWILLFSATTAVMGTIFLVRSQRKIARRKATVEMLMNNLWDQDCIIAKAEFNSIVLTPDVLVDVHKKSIKKKELVSNGEWSGANDEARKEIDEACLRMDKIRLVLNNYELICIGIREGIYDEAIYRRWLYGTFLLDWRRIRIHVERIRSESGIDRPDRIYCEFEQLAARWQAEGPWGRQDKHIRLWGGRSIVVVRSR